MTVRFAPVLALALVATPALAQDEESGGSLMDRGVELFFDGLRQEMSPLMDNLRMFAEEYGPSMRSFIEEMGPAFGEMLAEVQDWADYHPPEILPNGDIIIRKKRDKTPDPAAPEELPPSGQIDL